jgi:ubiquinone/menaquinone biosynthesis C-methylase UbiE
MILTCPELAFRSVQTCYHVSRWCGQGEGVTNKALEANGLDQVVLGNPSYVWRSGQERRLDMVRRYLPLEGSRVLDLGCGIGSYVRRFSDFTPGAYGMDIDPERVVRGAQNGVDHLTVGVSEALPFADDAFDGVLLNEVIEHVIDERDTMREALRVTKPGGRVILFAPNRFYPFETHGVYLGKRYVFGNIPLVNYLPNFLRNRLVPHARAYTKGGLESLLKGLPARKLDWTVVYPGFDNVVGRKPGLGRWLRRITHALENTWFKRLGLSHFLVVERT